MYENNKNCKIRKKIQNESLNMSIPLHFHRTFLQIDQNRFNNNENMKISSYVYIQKD